MTDRNPKELDILREAVAEVRDLDSIQMREEFNIGKDIRNGKVGTTLGSGKAGTADTIQDKVMTKYGATKATVMNIAKGMKPKDALQAGMKQFAAGQSKHNPDVKSILSDLALNYPHIFSKYFKRSPAGTMATEGFEDDLELDEDFDEDGEFPIMEEIMIEGLLMLKEYVEEETGLELTMEEFSELVDEGVMKKLGTAISSYPGVAVATVRRDMTMNKAKKALAKGNLNKAENLSSHARKFNHGILKARHKIINS